MALTKVSGDFIKAGSVTQAHLHSSHGITTSHLTEGDKLFFTNARVDSRIGSLSSSDLSEGTNLYYTDARARAAIRAQDLPSDIDADTVDGLEAAQFIRSDADDIASGDLTFSGTVDITNGATSALNVTNGATFGNAVVVGGLVVKL